MAPDLLQLVARFDNTADVETPSAYFRTKLPSVGPEAYLHTIYKPALSALVAEVVGELKLPPSIREFYERCNGAHLFVSALSIFGCVPSGAMFNRADRFKLPPFDVREVNRELRLKLAKLDLVCIASYGYDGSLVCIKRQSQEAICFVGENVQKERRRWKSLDEWLVGEMERMSFLFDDSGSRLTEKEQLLPTCAQVN